MIVSEVRGEMRPFKSVYKIDYGIERGKKRGTG